MEIEGRPSDNVSLVTLHSFIFLIFYLKHIAHPIVILEDGEQRLGPILVNPLLLCVAEVAERGFRRRVVRVTRTRKYVRGEAVGRHVELEPKVLANLLSALNRRACVCACIYCVYVRMFACVRAVRVRVRACDRGGRALLLVREAASQLERHNKSLKHNQTHPGSSETDDVFLGDMVLLSVVRINPACIHHASQNLCVMYVHVHVVHVGGRA